MKYFDQPEHRFNVIDQNRKLAGTESLYICVLADWRHYPFSGGTEGSRQPHVHTCRFRMTEEHI